MAELRFTQIATGQHTALRDAYHGGPSSVQVNTLYGLTGDGKVYKLGEKGWLQLIDREYMGDE